MALVLVITLAAVPQAPLQDGAVKLASGVRKANFSVPPEPLRYYQESEEQKAAWLRAVSQCTPVNTEETPSDLCIASLTNYYIDQPVWDYSDIYYYDGIMGLRPLRVGRMNLRHRLMPFSYSDYAMGKFPLWSDLFDGRLKKRQDRFLQVLADASCMELSSRTSGGIHEEMSDRCSSREMYKYAAYLDSCAVASQRMNRLSAPNGRTQKFGNSSVYAVSVQVIGSRIEDQSSRDLALKRQQKGYLHAYWVLEQCESNGYTLLPSVNSSHVKQVTLRHDTNGYLEAIEQTHDVALTISARSGDEWAIRSHIYGIYVSDELNNQVREKFPLLMHRILGEGNLSGDLTPVDRKRHRAKAYLLLEEIAGTRAAQSVYKRHHLEEEIDYVQSGGELKYPRPREEILADRARQLQE